MTWAIVLAGGSGTRMGAGMNKVLLPVGGVPALVRSLRAFVPYVQGTVCVCRPEDEEEVRGLAEQYGLSFLIAPAGFDRQESVYNGLQMLPENARYVLVHDGARCLVSSEVIEAALASVKAKGSGVAAVAVKDTIKQAAPDGAVIATPDRAALKAVQTPQGFTVELLKKAHAAARQKGLRATDDAALVEALGETVYLTPGSEMNFKLTTPQDLVLAEALLVSHPESAETKASSRFRNWGPGAQPPLSSHPEETETKTASRFRNWGPGAQPPLSSLPEATETKTASRFGSWGPGAQPPLSSHPEATETKIASRFGSWGPGAQPLVGLGYDVHQLVEGRDLILCGVKVPHTLGLLGHSDADVALHALMDALLGAAGLHDIGRHFPDTDMRYKGISSMKLLNHVVALLHEKGYRPVNADVTIVAQKPKLLPYMDEMRRNTSQALNLPFERVNIKATTTEHLGFEGRQEGISAQAVCLLEGV